MKKITIIGSGATGTLLAINLIRLAKNQPLEINLVEKKERIGRGVAYSATTDFHLLNVPANKMGAFPDDLEHFYRWLEAKNYNFFPNDFVPRKLYGEYLRELFCETVKNKLANVRVNLLDDEAVDILTDEFQAQVILNSGEILYSDKVVLAFGNFPPPPLKSADREFSFSEKYFHNPWDINITKKINPADDVFIVGTGLTAIDAVLSLYHKRHAGKIYLFSTRGLLPATHQLGFVYPSFYDELNSQTKITDLLKIVRRHCKTANAQHSNWRGVIDSLRPHTQTIWQNLPEPEKRRFMQYLSRYWNAARHRMPPECAEVLDDLQTANQLQILKGRLKNIETNGKFGITISDGGAENQIFADAVINCIGSQSDFTKIDVPLVKNLIGRGFIKTDNLSLGIDSTADGRTIDKSGESSDLLFTIGTALKGILWESTAMPEIRVQANNLAFSLLRETDNGK